MQEHPQKTTLRIMASLLWLAASTAQAQAQVPALLQPPQNVLQLSATGTAEVAQDLMRLSLSATRQGADAAAVQLQLRNILEPALADLKRSAEPRQMEVRTGAFHVQPRYDRDGRVQGWTGTAELILEGRDLARISQAAARVSGMSIAGVSFGLSREQALRAQGQAEQQAIEQFRTRAASLARGFGFGDWTLREVTVQSNEQMPLPRPRVMAMEAKAAADTSVPLEAGSTTVVVTVSGSVQMR